MDEHFLIKNLPNILILTKLNQNIFVLVQSNVVKVGTNKCFDRSLVPILWKLLRQQVLLEEKLLVDMVRVDMETVEMDTVDMDTVDSYNLL